MAGIRNMAGQAGTVAALKASNPAPPPATPGQLHASNPVANPLALVREVPPAPDQNRSAGHCLHSLTLIELARHLDAGQNAADDASRDYNLRHAQNHISRAIDERDQLVVRGPGESRYYRRIGRAAQRDE